MNNKRSFVREVQPVLKKGISAIVILVLAGLWPVKASASTPDWLRSLAQQPAKHYGDDVDAVEMLDDQETTVRDNGEIVTHVREAYRILRPEGKEYTNFELFYDGETKINYLHGWSMTAKGQEYEAKDKDAFERNASTFEVFSDVKEKILLIPGGDVGTVVGFEYERKERPYVFDSRWSFQSMIPVEKARYTLQLPRNWEFKANWENHAEVQPTVLNGTYTWELSDLA